MGWQHCRWELDPLCHNNHPLPHLSVLTTLYTISFFLIYVFVGTTPSVPSSMIISPSDLAWGRAVSVLLLSFQQTVELQAWRNSQLPMWASHVGMRKCSASSEMYMKHTEPWKAHSNLPGVQCGCFCRISFLFQDCVYYYFKFER